MATCHDSTNVIRFPTVGNHRGTAAAALPPRRASAMPALPDHLTRFDMTEFRRLGYVVGL